MTSTFDTQVRERREHTPWSRINAFSFMREASWNKVEVPGDDRSPDDNDVVLRLRYRHDVASREWWSISWVSVDGRRYQTEAQYPDLCMWRAAEMELQVRERTGREEKEMNETQMARRDEHDD